MNKKIFNRGIPCKRNIVIGIDSLIYNCSTNKEEFIKQMRSEVNEFNNYMIKEYNLPFILTGDYYTININEKTLTSYLTFLPHLFIIEMCKCLNIEYHLGENYSQNQLLTLIRKKSSELGDINYSKKLKDNFPELYKKYEKINNTINEYNDKKKNKMTKYDEAYYKHLFNALSINPNSFSVKTFVKDNKKAFSRIANPEVFNNIYLEIGNCYIDEEKFINIIDEEKLDLYITCMIFEDVKNFNDTKVQNISYVLDYLNDHKDDLDDSINITIFKKNEKVIYTKKSLYNDYINYIKEHQDIDIIPLNKEDFEGKTIEEIEEYVKNYKSNLSVNWTLLDNPNDFIPKDYTESTTSLTDEEKEKRRLARIRILKEKIEFFKEHKPYKLLKGKEAFEGYTGYIYTTGYVVLDKLYKNKKETIPGDDAMYIMSVEDFIRLSTLSRPEIIANHLCPRIPHNKGWEQVALKYVNEDISLDTIIRTHTFDAQIRSLKN